MPSYEDAKGHPVVEFRSELEVSPFALFRALKDGREVLLVDVRRQPGSTTLEGAMVMEDSDWTPEDDAIKVVLFDEDTSEALPQVERLHQAGFEQVRALFGGLELYEFALDPQVVGEETYLVRVSK